MAMSLGFLCLALTPPLATPSSTPSPTRAATAPATSAPAPPSATATVPARTAPAGPGDWALPAVPTATQSQAAAVEEQSRPPLAPVPGPRPAKPQVGDILHPALWFAGVLLLAALAFAWLRRLRKLEEQSPEDQAHAQLATFRQMRDDGEMTEEEFKKVLLKLQGKIKPGADGDGPAAPAPAPPANGKPAKKPEA